jgi:hypothetical protein
LYPSAKNAASAASELKAQRFSENDVFVVGPAAPGASADDVTASIGQAGLAKADAAALADGVLKGGAVVVVHAAFGAAQKATNILDRFEPAKTAVPARIKTGPAASVREQGAAPLSTALNWQLSHDDPAPLSNALKWSLLNDFSLSKALNFAELSAEPGPVLSKAFGWALLSDDPTPLSTKLGWSVLKDDPTPLSTKAGWPLLRD